MDSRPIALEEKPPEANWFWEMAPKLSAVPVRTVEAVEARTLDAVLADCTALAVLAEPARVEE